MVTIYPAQIDTTTTLPVITDNASNLNSDYFNALRSAIINIETTLGVNPASPYGTVASALDALEGGINNALISLTGGDLGGTYEVPRVIKMQGYNISADAPTDGYVLTWSAGNNQWESVKITSGSVILGGDVTGSGASNTLVKIRGKSLATTLNSIGINQDGYVLTWVNGSSEWQAKPTANAFVGTGDLSGNYAAQTVIGIRGKSLNSSLASIGSSQDGYVLTWDNADGYWKANPVGNIPGAITTTMTSLLTLSLTNYSVNVFNTSFIRVSTSGSADFSISGLANGVGGQRLIIRNISNYVLTLNHEDGAATAANRIQCPGGVNRTVPSTGSVELIYDLTSARWGVI